MAFFEKTSTDLVRWTAKGVAEETGLRISVDRRGVIVNGRVVCESKNNDERFGYLNGLADGWAMAKEKL